MVTASEGCSTEMVMLFLYNYVLLVAALPSREHVFHVRFPSEWKASDLNHLFSPFGKKIIRHVTSQRSSERSDSFYFNSMIQSKN